MQFLQLRIPRIHVEEFLKWIFFSCIRMQHKSKYELIRITRYEKFIHSSQVKYFSRWRNAFYVWIWSIYGYFLMMTITLIVRTLGCGCTTRHPECNRVIWRWKCNKWRRKCTIVMSSDRRSWTKVNTIIITDLLHSLTSYIFFIHKSVQWRREDGKDIVVRNEGRDKQCNGFKDSLFNSSIIIFCSFLFT